jgi:hypothetical protein
MSAEEIGLFNQYPVLEIILKNWSPPIISVLLGGVIVSILVPRWQVRFEKSRLYDRRRLELLESIAGNFPHYVANWRRLMQISHHEFEKGQLTEGELELKARFVEERNNSRDKLFSDLSLASVYFSDTVVDLITRFSEWDQDCTALRLDELPDIGSWQEWEVALIKSMKAETLQSN